MKNVGIKNVGIKKQTTVLLAICLFMFMGKALAQNQYMYIMKNGAVIKKTIHTASQSGQRGLHRTCTCRNYRCGKFHWGNHRHLWRQYI